MMSSGFVVFRAGVALVLMCSFYRSTEDPLPELSPQQYFSTLQPGKASLAYFCQVGSLSNSVFLEELKEAIRPLQDYGISVSKVNCVEEEASRYCGKEEGVMKAYLFRGHILLREFPTDTLFDVNAIVAHVLFTLLFNEVKYVTTLEDLHSIENSLKGKANMIFSYVEAIGTPEHRAVMEAAFVYGTSYQFALTTEIALLENIGSENTGRAHLYFLHCELASDLTESCRTTRMEQPLTTLNIHVFIKTMKAPLVMEVAEDPQQVSIIHLQLGLPLVFIISQQATYEADRRTAEWVAWRLLGKAGVLLLSRDSVDVDIPQHANVAFRRAEKEAPVEFLVLNDVDLIVSHVKSNMYIEETQEDEDGDEEGPDLAIQDDEVAETVYRDRKRPLPLELTVELTQETFNSTVTTSDSLVLFYATWHAVSMAFLQSYIDVAIKLKGTSTILLTRINCADWSDVCAKQNVTAFPAVKLYKEGESPVSYEGMLGTKDLLKFVQLNRISCPVNIASIQEAEKYLRGELYKDLFSFPSVSVLGLFSPAMASAEEHFREAGKRLRGSIITGVYSEDDVWILSNKYAAPLPAMLLARPREGGIESVPLATAPVQEMVRILANAPLEAFPEITVETLPAYLRLQRPLLMLFSDGSIDPQYRNAALALVRQKQLEPFTPCWLNLKNTPVGRGILKVYFGHLPPLPQLLLVNLHSGGQVYAFPSVQSITEQSLMLWLKKLEAGLENPITIISDQAWKPPLPAFDFLSMMDAPAAQASAKKGAECMEAAEVQASAEQPRGGGPAPRREPPETLRVKHWNRSIAPREAGEPSRPHKEL
ncbi:thioredoxin domain-containing protein 16 isoform X1 [Mesocricetus auratus]|uniref:Thioredoxin domain-containing protein 16 isoform X1 n=1 Tax=Mesocricetus auratus TaxID=10036 RepID=A0ABM2WTI4_MESAU|nr:thioredoxin domain-containing protein 16 isoform X1 [Mesocricetus auratus]XP_040591676.1 thioredoxin domain-containing protein 16 isoform X1 [Mesocricetus auratus]XP_040591677.1 thioredoxin domain-containing protein 16 isoform X1 [Mesocricetus auratus]XP_040591678.1 thioredoxin domain-containing protein 16 isoform X1 [Mesocricetus auratus]XP_040591679.1 thioredoxin domain-containing protein 16 isoform X1 [Mesocricetus auratus]XP_040591680.1 thioredoxin domain-containing protein 16 isoform X